MIPKTPREREMLGYMRGTCGEEMGQPYGQVWREFVGEIDVLK